MTRRPEPPVKAYPADATPNERLEIAKAATLLRSFGYVVLRAKSWRQAAERQRIDRHMREDYHERMESAYRWAQTDLHNEIRELQARCTALYGAARAHGATAEELANLDWKTTGINCPHCSERYAVGSGDPLRPRGG